MTRSRVSPDGVGRVAQIALATNAAARREKPDSRTAISISAILRDSPWVGARWMGAVLPAFRLTHAACQEGMGSRRSKGTAMVRRLVCALRFSLSSWGMTGGE